MKLDTSGTSKPLEITDSEGQRQPISEDTPLPVIMAKVVELLDILVDSNERIVEQLALMTDVSIGLGERLED